MQASLPQDAEDDQNSCPVSSLNPGYAGANGVLFGAAARRHGLPAAGGVRTVQQHSSSAGPALKSADGGETPPLQRNTELCHSECDNLRRFLAAQPAE
jgi:hypothetical protein